MGTMRPTLSHGLVGLENRRQASSAILTSVPRTAMIVAHATCCALKRTWKATKGSQGSRSHDLQHVHRRLHPMLVTGPISCPGKGQEQG
jgi:hypothetical protein